MLPWVPYATPEVAISTAVILRQVVCSPMGIQGCVVKTSQWYWSDRRAIARLSSRYLQEVWLSALDGALELREQLHWYVWKLCKNNDIWF
jgi:hypothetical protein